MLSKAQKTFFLSVVLLVHSFILLKQLKVFESKKTVKTAQAEKKIRLKIRPPVKKKKVNQIVNTQKQKNTARPKDPKYLSHSNQSFERETVAAKVGAFKEAGKGDTKVNQKKAEPVKKQVAQKPVQPPKKMVKPSKKGKISFSDLAPKATKLPPKQVKKIAAARQGLKNGNKSKRGLSQNNDFVEDIPMGDMTKLNTQEFKYYGFYHRIRVKLEQYWENSLRKKVDSIYRQGRRVASDDQKITSLQIKINSKGHIVDVRVKASSGIKELDDAAVESFNRAGPFPNPPAGMIKNGYAVLDWGFVVKS